MNMKLFILLVGGTLIVFVCLTDVTEGTIRGVQMVVTAPPLPAFVRSVKVFSRRMTCRVSLL